MTWFSQLAERHTGHRFADFVALHDWSVNCPGAFWSLAWDACGGVGEKGARAYDPDPLRAQFFPDARLNVVNTILRNPDGRDAIIFIGENGARISWSRADLLREVTALATALTDCGVGRGDYVAGLAPNMPQTVAAMLATASLGAVWTSSAPESGADIVVDRFAQAAPKVLFTSDGYAYGGKVFETRHVAKEISDRLPSISKVIVWPYIGAAKILPDGMISYDTFKAQDPSAFEPVPVGFRDPQYVLFSSGTTGKPKAFEHSAGGTFLRLMVEHQLHFDLSAGDRMLYYTTCNWIMWNWQVAALASEVCIILHDGNPMYPEAGRLFDLLQSEAVTHFGVSAKFIDTTLKRGFYPEKTHNILALRVVMSTGSPLSPDGFHQVYADWKADVQLASICGGTDIFGAFNGGNPNLPVNAGEITCPMLGVDVAVLDADGTEHLGTAGELVCRNAHPSMPIRFLGDPDMSLYCANNFDTFLNIWRQGDCAVQTGNGRFVVLGRSDATLNPGGVRIGTAEIYRQIEKIAQIEDAVVIGQSTHNDVRVVLFVKLPKDQTLDDSLCATIKATIRANASPRHVPAVIVQVRDIPWTKSGKTAELAVADIVNQLPARDLSGLINPDVLHHFKNHPKFSLEGTSPCH